MTDIDIYKSPDQVIKAAMNSDQPEELQAAIAMIPSHFGFDEKATYLGFRALGFTARQAMEAMGLVPYILELWYEADPEMKKFEMEHLPELQRICGFELTRILFMRNMAMFHFQDSWLLGKSLTPEGLEQMSRREWETMNSRRSFYSATNLNALGKFGEPEKSRGGARVAIQINNGPMFVVEADEDLEQPEMKMVEAPDGD